MALCLMNPVDFENILSNIYINDAYKIKEYVKENFSNWIDVEKNEIFKDINKQ